MTTWMHDQRLAAVLAALRDCGAATIVDLGCGDGALLLRLAKEPAVRRIVGMDLSAEALARLRANVQDAPADTRQKIELVHGSIARPPVALTGFDAAVLVETIEHVDPDRLSAIERSVFQEIRAKTVVITTPNSDFNPLLGVPVHRFRHPDHRFEWGREKFRSWIEGVAGRNDYGSSCHDVGGAHPVHGGATQMAILKRLPGVPELTVAQAPNASVTHSAKRDFL